MEVELREKGERRELRGEFFDKGEREAWRGKNVKVALRGRGEWEALKGRGDDENRHGQGAGGRWVRLGSGMVQKGGTRGTRFEELGIRRHVMRKKKSMFEMLECTD